MIEALRHKRIAVFNGGFSSEREVSFRSGKNVYDALKRLGYTVIRIDPAVEDFMETQFDVVFNCLHGTYGEDGSIQSLLDFYGIPYTGSGPQASMLGMNKVYAKMMMVSRKLPTPQYAVVTKQTYKDAVISVPFPWIIKPVDQGSSVGLLICDNRDDYLNNVGPLLDHYGCCLLEECIVGQEITVGVLGQGDSAYALPILELRPKKRTYDYEAKYTHGMTDFILPANLSPELTDSCQQLAVTLHRLMGCKGMSRTDMMVDPKRGAFILEINTIPGMTDLSDLPAQAKTAGISFDALVEIILESALR